MNILEKFWDTTKRYSHLFNPLATLVYDPKDVRTAPTGNMRLAEDDKLNTALWNSIFVAGSWAPAAFLINAVANLKAKGEVEDAYKKSLVDKLNALRPRVVADPNLKDVSAYTNLPEKEYRELKDLQKLIGKRASVEKRAEDTFQQMVSKAVDGFVANAMPLALGTTSVLASIGLSNYLAKKSLKKELGDRRVQLRNVQAALDREMLREADLIKTASATGLDKKAEDDILSRTKPAGPERSNFFEQVGLSLPVLGWTLLALSSGIGGYAILRKRDKNLAKLKMLREQILGSNDLKDTPKINVIDLPVKAEEILAVPGDKKQQTLIEESKPIALLENKEILTEVLPKDKKKDAIF